MNRASERSEKDPARYAGVMLLTMWKSPCMAAWFFVAVVLVAVPRLVFFPAQALPYCVQLNPGCAMIPVCGMVFGPAGVWGSVVATVLADSMIGMGSALTVFRAVGVFMFAYSSQILWASFRRRADQPESYGLMAWRFLIAVAPGLVMNAVWVGFGSEWLRLYPFSYVTLIILVQNLVFVPLVGIPALHGLTRQVVKRRGAWLSQIKGEIPGARQTQWPCIVLLWIGALGAMVAGFVAARQYGISPVTALNIGVTDCPGVLWAVLPFLLMQLGGVFSPWALRRNW